MFSKIVAFGALLAAASASPYGQGDVAVSSQSVIREDGSHHHSAPSKYSSYVHHVAPASHYTPSTHYSAPAVYYDDHEKYSHPKYDFSYSVDDAHTGDRKSQQESRDGDRVQGYYTLVQPDGAVRKVTYTANEHNGFNADVSYTASSEHIQNYKHSYQH